MLGAETRGVGKLKTQVTKTYIKYLFRRKLLNRLTLSHWILFTKTIQMNRATIGQQTDARTSRERCRKAKNALVTVTKFVG